MHAQSTSIVRACGHDRMSDQYRDYMRRYGAEAMTTLSEEQIRAAHAAFEKAAALWVISGVKDQHRWCVHRDHTRISPTTGTIALTGDDAIAEWRFDTREEATFFKRDKCLRAALEAALGASS